MSECFYWCEGSHSTKSPKRTTQWKHWDEKFKKEIIFDVNVLWHHLRKNLTYSRPLVCMTTGWIMQKDLSKNKNAIGYFTNADLVPKKLFWKIICCADFWPSGGSIWQYLSNFQSIASVTTSKQWLQDFN